jgi:uncharacterized protein
VLVIDVNVLVGAFHREAHDHEACRAWLADVVNSEQSFGFPDFVMFNFVRVVTLPRPWKQAIDTSEALRFIEQLMRTPNCQLLVPTERHWSVFQDLCIASGARGNLINDAYLAAFALDHDAEVITFDQDFAKFPRLKWRSPFEQRVIINPP